MKVRTRSPISISAHHQGIGAAGWRVVVSHGGIALCKCRYLDAVAAQVDVSPGLGSRHIAAAKMSVVTKAVGIVVSESSVVRLFCHEQLVGEMIPELLDDGSCRPTFVVR